MLCSYFDQLCWFKMILLINFEPWWNLNWEWAEHSLCAPPCFLKISFLRFILFLPRQRKWLFLRWMYPPIHQNSAIIYTLLHIYRANVYGFMPPQSMFLWIWKHPNIGSSSNENTNCYIVESNMFYFQVFAGRGALYLAKEKIFWSK